MITAVPRHIPILLLYHIFTKRSDFPAVANNVPSGENLKNETGWAVLK